ncbi:MAG: FTR1 family iron permease [Gaiellales bacterium]
MATTSPHRAETRFDWKPAVIWIGSAVFLIVAVILMATAPANPVGEEEMADSMSAGTAVFNSAMIVFREGLEAALVLAAITAGMVGVNRFRRKPVFWGAAAALVASALTWVFAGMLLARFADLGVRLEAITGFLAVFVLILVLNWFMHNVYWTGWLANQHARKRQILSGSGAGVMIGLGLLGFTSVFREGFETVLFLQNARLLAGTGPVFLGIAIGLGLTAAVGLCLFVFQHRLPYRKMLIATGVVLSVVLVIMVGGTAHAFQELGWLPETDVLVGVIPEWFTEWFKVYPTVETIVLQLVAVGVVVGSYFLAEYIRVTRPRCRGGLVATPAAAPPAAPAPDAPTPVADPQRTLTV